MGMDARKVQDLLGQLQKAQEELDIAKKEAAKAQTRADELKVQCDALSKKIAAEIENVLSDKPEEAAPDSQGKRIRRTKAQVASDLSRLETAVLHILGRAGGKFMNKGEILSKSGLNPSLQDWSAVISRLLKDKKIVSEGEKASTVYRSA